MDRARGSGGGVSVLVYVRGLAVSVRVCQGSDRVFLGLLGSVWGLLVSVSVLKP